MKNSHKASVSVIVITGNEEKNIRKCLESVSWSDDIVVVDSYSDDATVDIAKQFTDKVFLRAFTNFSDQRQYASSLCSNDWIMWVDADEVVTDELRDEIVELLPKQNYDYYYVPAISKMIGGWVKHGMWYPSYKLRLYRKDKGRWDGVVHEQLAVEGSFGFMRNSVLHFDNRTVSGYSTRTDKYTESDIAGIEKAPRFLAARMIFKPIHIFIKNYFVQGSILDGTRGLIVSTLRAAYEFTYYAKIWEKFHSGDESIDPEDLKETLRVKLIRLAFTLKRRLA